MNKLVDFCTRNNTKDISVCPAHRHEKEDQIKPGIMLVLDKVAPTQINCDRLTPDECQDVLNAMLDGYLNYCKLQNLVCWEHDHSTSNDHLRQQIAEIKEKKAALKQTIDQARAEGRKLNIATSFELTLE